ncbi:MAG: hypothetical protein Fur0018_00400 [Anaerolineales bacterium]
MGWLFLDLVFYTFLPLIGLRHLFFLGGTTPEPLEGALQFSLSAGFFLPAVGVVAVLMMVENLRLLSKEWRRM